MQPLNLYLGTISLFGFNFAPVGWAQCQGQIMSISQNTALFSLLGTNFGGNGTSTFGLPNLQGAAAIGMGQGPGLSSYNIGQTGGTNNVSLNSTNMPAHTHGLTVKVNANSVRTGGVTTPVNNFPNTIASGTVYSARATSGTFMGGNTVIAMGPAGGNTPMSVQRPSLVTNYCIALYGIFPQRQ